MSISTARPARAWHWGLPCLTTTVHRVCHPWQCRAQVVIGYTIALAAAILGFWSTPNIAWVQWLSVASVRRVWRSTPAACMAGAGCRAEHTTAMLTRKPLWWPHAQAAGGLTSHCCSVVYMVVSQVGAALYGPQMLIGLCGAEAVSKTAVSAAQGFLG
jgi:hypothetical protein